LRFQYEKGGGWDGFKGSGCYYLTLGILDNKEGLEDKNDVTTDRDIDSEPDFDDLNDDVFDPIFGADYDIADDYMDVD
jgi:hypothetical protein